MSNTHNMLTILAGIHQPLKRHTKLDHVDDYKAHILDSFQNFVRHKPIVFVESCGGGPGPWALWRGAATIYTGGAVMSVCGAAGGLECRVSILVGRDIVLLATRWFGTGWRLLGVKVFRLLLEAGVEAVRRGAGAEVR